MELKRPWNFIILMTMNKDKYDFIQEILSNKRLTLKQQKKLFDLTSKEIRKDKFFGFGLEERITKLEKELSNTKTPINEELSKIHSPKGMVKFLYQFSSDEQYKWFTHKPDLKVDEINYLSRIENFKKIKIPFNLNYSTILFIKSFFLKDEKLSVFHPGFTTELTYSNEKILTEIKKGINPFDIIINKISFVDIINKFKNAIEFRLDKDKYTFDNLFMDFITNKISVDINEKYTYDFLKNSKILTTYIDVNNFFRGIYIIMEWVNKYKSLSNELIIDLKEENDYYLLILFHKGSKIHHDPFSLKLNGLGGDFDTLRKYWFSIVDFEIEADFAENNKSYHLICLNNETQLSFTNPKLSENLIIPIQDSVGGVKYFIKIYKNN
ncbi:MAG: hypothetical protein COZ74_13555 [Flavobacteriaceae bacterium CG_4_8_14_3_um_filter_31_8]|nr:MAG: hypothetical protein COZ74_13555 [Flavobacteriaceae bacterium CG_4_8_14_3_um_filter_31_8]